jgi:hypothetical protein
MNQQPKPPFLVIRERQSFWIEQNPPNLASVTPQAFEEGCFRDACCYDATGSLWRVTSAVLKTSPSVVQRTMPWRQVQVELHLGEPAQFPVADVVSLLALILQQENEFTDSIDSLADVIKRFREAVTPADIIRVALSCQ